MIEISLSDGERSLLQELHRHHIHHVIRQRAHVLLLRAERLPNAQISHITGLGETTVIDYVHQYLKDGERWLTTLNFRKPVSQLQPFDEAIKTYFDKHPVSTVTSHTNLHALSRVN